MSGMAQVRVRNDPWQAHAAQARQQFGRWACKASSFLVKAPFIGFLFQF
jgi:hypothetical protein